MIHLYFTQLANSFEEGDEVSSSYLPSLAAARQSSPREHFHEEGQALRVDALHTLLPALFSTLIQCTWKLFNTPTATCTILHLFQMINWEEEMIWTSTNLYTVPS